MDKLTLWEMFKILKVEEHKETMYRIMDRVDPEIRVELIKYLIAN